VETAVAQLKNELEALEEFLRRWAPSPLLFVQECLKAEPTEQQRRALEAVGPGKRITIRSGHGTGKTALLAWLILWFNVTRINPRVPCTATTAPQLHDVLWAELSKWHSKMDPRVRDLFEIRKERFYFKLRRLTWFAVARTARKEQPDALQGFHADDLMYVCDEASGIPDEIFEPVEGALTSGNAILILAGNPIWTYGYFYDSHHKDRALYDRFHFSSLDSPLVHPSYPKRIARKWGKESNVYLVRVEGEFPKDLDDLFIPYHLVQAAVSMVQVEPMPEDALVYGVDPARFGDDESALVKRRGGKVIEVIGLRKHDTMAVAGWVANHARRDKPSCIFVDSIGIGAGVADRLRELGFHAIDVNVQTRDPGTRDDVADLRTELWHRVRDELEKGRLDLPDDEDLVGQLTTPLYIFNSKGKMLLEPKDKMKARGKESPDRADALVMTYFMPVAAASQDEDDEDLLDEYYRQMAEGELPGAFGGGY